MEASKMYENIQVNFVVIPLRRREKEIKEKHLLCLTKYQAMNVNPELD
jgi:hypothetical protein